MSKYLTSYSCFSLSWNTACPFIPRLASNSSWLPRLHPSLIIFRIRFHFRASSYYRSLFTLLIIKIVHYLFLVFKDVLKDFFQSLSENFALHILRTIDGLLGCLRLQPAVGIVSVVLACSEILPSTSYPSFAIVRDKFSGNLFRHLHIFKIYINCNNP